MMSISSPYLRRILVLLKSDTESFAELAELGGLDPSRSFRGANLRGVDFGTDSLKGFNFSSADLTGSNISQARDTEFLIYNEHTIWPSYWYPPISESFKGIADHIDFTRQNILEAAKSRIRNPELVALIKSSTGADWFARQKSVRSLRQHVANPIVKQALLTSLRDDAWSVRLEAVRALSPLSNHADVKFALQQAVPDEDDDVVQAIFQTLYGEELDADVCKEFLNNKRTSFGVKSSILMYLQKNIHKEESIDLLLCAIKDSDLGIRRRAAEMMYVYPVSKVTKELLYNLSKDSFSAVRVVAIRMLSRFIDEDDVVSFMLLSTIDDNVDVRIESVKVLRDIFCQERVRHRLFHIVDDTNAQVRQTASSIICDNYNYPGVQEIIKIMSRHRDVNIRIMSKGRLSSIWNKEAKSHLISLLVENTDDAIETLDIVERLLDNHDIIHVYTQCVSPLVRERCLFSISAMSNVSSNLRFLVEAYAAGSTPIKRAAIKAMVAHINHPEIYPVFVRSVSDKDAEVRQTTMSGLKAISYQPGVLDICLQALSSQFVDVRRAAAGLLGLHVENQTVYDALSAAREDEDGLVRIAANQSLRARPKARL